MLQRKWIYARAWPDARRRRPSSTAVLSQGLFALEGGRNGKTKQLGFPGAAHIAFVSRSLHTSLEGVGLA
jgi:hypothetical protein